jgi:hypothetical protein
MRPNTVFLAGGTLALGFGLSFLLVPTVVLPLYGAPTDPATLLMSRFFGVALAHLGLVLYFLRDTRDHGVQRALGLAGIAGSAAGIAVAVIGIFGGVTNALGWSTVAIYAFLLLGYASVLRGRTAVA